MHNSTAANKFIIFSVLIIVIGVFAGTPFYTANFSNENRRGAEWPDIEQTGIGKYPAAVSSYLNDHFLFRTEMIESLASMKFNVLGISVNEKVLIGADGWLYNYPQYVAKGYKTNSFFTDEVITDFAVRMKKLETFLKAKNIKLYVYINPTKPTVYPEHLPGWVKQNEYAVTPTLIFNAFQQSIDSDVIYPLGRAHSLKEMQEKPLFFKYDHHWTPYYAYLEYLELMKIIGEKDEIKMLVLDEWSDKLWTWKELVHARILNQKGLFENMPRAMIPMGQRVSFSKELESAYSLKARIWQLRSGLNNEKTPMSVLTISDSFFRFSNFGMSDYLAGTFERLDQAHYAGFPAIVEALQKKLMSPDIVILQVPDGNLENLYRAMEDIRY